MKIKQYLKPPPRKGSPTQHNHPPSRGSWATKSNRLPVYRNFHHWSFYHHFPPVSGTSVEASTAMAMALTKMRASSSRGNFCWLVTGTSGSSEKMLLGRLAFPCWTCSFEKVTCEKSHHKEKKSCCPEKWSLGRRCCCEKYLIRLHEVFKYASPTKSQVGIMDK